MVAHLEGLRAQLAALLEWQDAHADFDAAVKNLPADLRGRTPQGLPYSPWQLVEHLRLAQRDILEFCVNPDYEEMTWPQDYWPVAAEPPAPDAWDRCLAGVRRDCESLRLLGAWG